MARNLSLNPNAPSTRVSRTTAVLAKHGFGVGPEATEEAEALKNQLETAKQEAAAAREEAENAKADAEKKAKAKYEAQLKKAKEAAAAAEKARHEAEERARNAEQGRIVSAKVKKSITLDENALRSAEEKWAKENPGEEFNLSRYLNHLLINSVK